jgi:hypothetical protein
MKGADMPAARKRTTRRSGRGPAAAARKQGDASLERLNKSLDVAQKALADLSKELSRGGRGLVGELRKDIGQLGDTIAGRGGGSKRASARRGAAKRKTAKRKTAARRSTAKRSTARKSTAKRSTAKKATAKKAKRS